MTNSWKVIRIILYVLVAASGWIVALRRPATVAPMPAGAEWHGSPEQGAALIEKKKRDDAFREKYGVDPVFNPTPQERAIWEKMQKEEREAQERRQRDRAAGKMILPP